MYNRIQGKQPRVSIEVSLTRKRPLTFVYKERRDSANLISLGAVPIESAFPDFQGNAAQRVKRHRYAKL